MTLVSSILVKSDHHHQNGVEKRRNWTMVCAPIMSEDSDEMLVQMRKAEEDGADIVEIRMDHLKKKKKSTHLMSPQQCVEILIKHSPLPTIITYREQVVSKQIRVNYVESNEQVADIFTKALLNCQFEYLKRKLGLSPANMFMLEDSKDIAANPCRKSPTWEGGQYSGDEATRQATLLHAIDTGADFIEIELKVATEFFKSLQGKKPGKTKIIVSSHNYETTPSAEVLGNLAARIQATGADIVKIVTTAQDINDSARIFQLLVHSQVPTIGLAMGEKGFISRILCAKYGGFLTYASLEHGIASATWPPTVKDLLGLYNFRKMGPDTKVHGVIGNPISHSKSPHLYNPAFRSAEFDGVYLPLLVDNVASFLKTYSSPDFVGYSFTVPHKESGLRCCDEIDPIAKEIGAISCMLRKPDDGKLIGYNMDYLGAIAAIEEGLRASSYDRVGVDSPLAGKLLVVIGAGGAGKALAYAGKEKGARVVVTDAIYDKAKELASKVGGKVITLSELDGFHPEDGMILANATPVGMEPDTEATPISKDALRNYSLVFDAIYTPKWTRLLKEARETGAKVVFGTEMFVNQAFIQFKKFTGLTAPRESMRRTLAKYA